ncbi:MAG: hypothetical protein IAE67_11415 [Candidatus Competibacteraceae bacterium]|nr:hypothetical protein [Candidatus Competibacteraceae bacterium]
MPKLQRKSEIEGAVIFSEEQRLWDTWIRYFLMVEFLFIFTLVSVLMIQDKANSMADIIFSTVMVFVIGLAGILLIRVFMMDVRVTTKGIYVRYKPIDRKYYFIPQTEIRSWEITKNQMMQSGKNIRKQSATFTMISSRVILIHTSDRKIRIGTNRTSEFSDAISRMQLLHKQQY